ATFLLKLFVVETAFTNSCGIQYLAVAIPEPFGDCLVNIDAMGTPLIANAWQIQQSSLAGEFVIFALLSIRSGNDRQLITARNGRPDRFVDFPGILLKREFVQDDVALVRPCGIGIGGQS